MLCAGSGRSGGRSSCPSRTARAARRGGRARPASPFSIGYAISYAHSKVRLQLRVPEFASAVFSLAQGADRKTPSPTGTSSSSRWAFTAAAATIPPAPWPRSTAFQAYIAYSFILSASSTARVHWIWDTAGGSVEAKTRRQLRPPQQESRDASNAGSRRRAHDRRYRWSLDAAIVGPRTGRFDASGRPMAMPGHNAALVVLGTFILWVGWYG